MNANDVKYSIIIYHNGSGYYADDYEFCMSCDTR